MGTASAFHTNAGLLPNGWARWYSTSAATSSSSPEAPTFAWPGHVDHARREYLATLIEHHHGDLHEIAKHWDRTSEHTLLKAVRQFGLEDALRAARRARK